MGRKWDAPWKYNFSDHGFTDGEDRRPAPSFTSTRNPTCQNCGLRQQTWPGEPDKCECEEPEFDLVQDKASDRQKFQAWCITWLIECFRVLVPGGTIKVFGAPRMFHRMAAAMEEVGFTLLREHSLEGWGYGCLSEDTEILTEGGWKPGIHVATEERVACWHPDTGRVSSEAVEQVTVAPFKRGNMVAFHNDHTDQLLTPNHRVYYRQDGRWEVNFAEALVQTSWLQGPTALPIQDVQGVLAQTWVIGKFAPYEGLVWCVKVPTGVFVARRNGGVFVTGNSGFPKSLSISKALDKAAGVERTEVIGTGQAGAAFHYGQAGFGTLAETDRSTPSSSWAVTAPATKEAQQFNGYGTALKPAWEVFLIGRKLL